jgi:hypothetical protein
MINKLRAATDTIREVAGYYCLLILVSTLVIMYADGNPLWKSLYWSVMTSTTVGYGDIVPKSPLAEADAMFTAIFSVFGIGPLLIARLIELFIGNKDMDHLKQQIADLTELVKNK